MTDNDKRIEQLENDVMSLKIKVKKIEDFVRAMPNPDEYMRGEDYIESEDEILDAAKLVLQFDKVSASLIQRRLNVGYARAARILDKLEELGIVSEADGSKPRKALVKDVDDLRERLKK
jgi:DNA segregation ATPase FtsK/SpoIIIE-like protein